MIGGRQLTPTNDETSDDDITGQRARPNGNTADHVNEAGHKKFMGNLKGILKHYQQDIKDERWLRFVVSIPLDKNVPHIGELTQAERDKAWKAISTYPEEAFINIRSHYEQARDADEYTPAED